MCVHVRLVCGWCERREFSGVVGCIQWPLWLLCGLPVSRGKWFLSINIIEVREVLVCAIIDCIMSI